MSGLIDTSVFCGCWPFRATLPRRAGEIKKLLQEHGVTRAWLSSAEAILAADPMQANEPLAEETGKDDFFVTMAGINPMLATWKQDARRAVRELGFRGLKIYPSYHRYKLTDAAAEQVADFAAELDVPLCVQFFMMDERSQHPACVVDPAKPEEMAQLTGKFPDTRFLACGVTRWFVERLAGQKNVWAEISLVEADATLAHAVKQLGPDRIVFGSHSPMQYMKAMTAKLDVMPGDVSPEAIEKVKWENAVKLLDGSARKKA